ncbi:hypothetical protein ACJX0J_028129, partial [Zea mays]
RIDVFRNKLLYDDNTTYVCAIVHVPVDLLIIYQSQNELLIYKIGIAWGGGLGKIHRDPLNNELTCHGIQHRVSLGEYVYAPSLLLKEIYWRNFGILRF